MPGAPPGAGIQRRHTDTRPRKWQVDRNAEPPGSTGKENSAGGHCRYLSLTHKERMDNKIKYEDKASLSVPGRGRNHTGEHCTKEKKKQKKKHHNQKEEAMLRPAAHGVHKQKRSHKT